MTHDEWVRWLDQIESSLVRAETAKKDIDTIVMLRLAYQICKDQVKGTEPKKGEEEKKEK